MDEPRAVIIGAGPAGVATAVSLRDRGVASVLVDRAGLVAASWRARYDRLTLNTGKQFSHLPGRPYPVETPTFPTRDHVAHYFTRGYTRSQVMCCIRRHTETPLPTSARPVFLSAGPGIIGRRAA